MKKLLLLLTLSFFSAQSFAGSCPDGSDPVKSISADGTYFVYNCGGNTNAFDGEYPFVLSRFKPSEGPRVLGSGVLVIKNGTISVSPKHRQLETSSTKYYDTLEGQINKNGKINVKFNVNPLTGKGKPHKVSFSGNINNLQIKGKFDDWQLIIDISTGEYRLTGRRSLSTTSWGYSIVSDIVRAGKDSQRFEVRPGDCGEDPGKWSDCDNNRERSEISLDRKFLPGDNQWIGFSLYIPEHYQTSNYVATTLGQIHQSGGNRPTGTAAGLKSFPPVLQLEAKGGYYDACIHILSGPKNNVRDICELFTLSSISDMLGRWTDIEIHFDTTDKKSLIEIYVNKERKVLREDFVKFWPQKYHVKYGIYRSFVSRHDGPMPTQIVWFDEIKMGNTR